MENENILRVFYNRVYEYFTLRGARRVFFFALIAVLITALIFSIVNTPFTIQLFVSACTVCVLATLTDSLQAKAELNEEVKKIEYSQFKRMAERYGDQTAEEVGPTFSQEELFFIKREKRQINYSIVIKLVFLLFFVVFLFGGV